MIALERPGASGDARRLRRPRRADRTSKPRFPLPDFSGALQVAKGLGLRSWPPACSALIKWDDVARRPASISRARPLGLGHQPQLEPEARQEATSSVCSSSFGEGIQNYMNDSPVDVGVVNNPRTTVTPIRRRDDPAHVGIVAFRRSHLEREVLQHRSATRGRTTTTPTQQAPSAFTIGQYALGNLLITRRRT